MSAEVLRQAAALMRERAEAASPAPWAWEPVGEMDNGWCLGLVWGKNGPLTGRIEPGAGDFIDGVCENVDADHFGNAEHIASWHPVVALTVADWLDEAARSVVHGFDPDDCPTCRAALAVARAYLGSES